MMDPKQVETNVRYELFDKFALKDQQNYYEYTVETNEKALRQVNQIRAILAFSTGVAAALAALLTQLYYTDGARCGDVTVTNPTGAEMAGCSTLSFVILLCIVLSIILPAIGGFFNSLMDLFQWDRLISIYESASENIKKADSLSPDLGQPEPDYYESYEEYVKGTLRVMHDETAQWGQSIRAPQSMKNFVETQRKIANKSGGDAESAREEANKPPDSLPE